MRILLIEPPFERLMGFYRDYFPISLACLGAVLEQAGHSVLIYDAEHGSDSTYLGYRDRSKRYDSWLQALSSDDHDVWREAERLIKDYRPEVVGISVMTVKLAAALKIAKITRSAAPGSKIVFGGPHPTIMPDKVIESGYVDYAVRGEGETTMLELLRALDGDIKISDVKGITYDSNNAIVSNPERERIGRISTLPHPARHLLYGLETYSDSDLGLMMTSRGCPFTCTYCSSQCMWGRRVRYRDILDVVDEIEDIRDRYKVKHLTLEDDSFTVNKKRVFQLCDELKKRRIKVRWSVITRIDLLDDEMLMVMKQAGCDHVRVGVESGSDRVLNAINKGIDTEQIRLGAQLLHRHKMYWSAYFMVGLPEETAQDIRLTISLMKEIKPSYSTLSVFTPYPGTAIFEDLVRLGLASENMDWSKTSHHSPYNYFSPKIDRHDFEALLAEAEEAFDSQNRRLISLIAKARSRSGSYMRDPRQMLIDAKRFLYWSGMVKSKAGRRPASAKAPVGQADDRL